MFMALAQTFFEAELKMLVLLGGEESDAAMRKSSPKNTIPKSTPRHRASE
jgi:hypothetical protein